MPRTKSKSTKGRRRHRKFLTSECIFSARWSSKQMRERTNKQPVLCRCQCGNVFFCWPNRTIPTIEFVYLFVQLMSHPLFGSYFYSILLSERNRLSKRQQKFLSKFVSLLTMRFVIVCSSTTHWTRRAKPRKYGFPLGVNRLFKVQQNNRLSTQRRTRAIHTLPTANRQENNWNFCICQDTLPNSSMWRVWRAFVDHALPFLFTPIPPQ